MKILQYLNDSQKIIHLYLIYPKNQEKIFYNCIRYTLPNKDHAPLLFASTTSFKYAYWDRTWNVTNGQVALQYNRFISILHRDAHKNNHRIFKIPKILIPKYIPALCSPINDRRYFIETINDDITGKYSPAPK